jgi:cell division protein FtsQ
VTDESGGPRFRRSPAGAVALTALVLGLGGWGVVNSPLFHTRRIMVTGARQVPQARVIHAAGVERGENLVLLSLDDVAARVERLPWVAQAVADRDLPSTLTIRVVERTPVGWLDVPNGMAVVARDGTVLQLLSAAPARIPGLGEGTDPLIAGEPVGSSLLTFRVAASMDRSLLRRVALATGSEGQVSLELRKGGSVRYGAPTELVRKNLELARLLRWARRQEVLIDSIDLRIPQAPTLDPVGPEVSSPLP